VPTALVVGATGLVGRHTVRLLAGDDHYERVIVVARRPLTEPIDRVEQRIVHFDQLHDHRHALTGDHVFCALGTTRRAAGSRDAFREVDLRYPQRIAEIARANGARHFCLVSASGASSRSPFFYSRVKAEAEAAVRAAGYPSGAILRPSILGGQRHGRPLERIAQAIMRLAPARWRTIDAADVARAAVRVARAEPPGWRVLESDEIRRAARGD
jgi:uncharacterized protein YbjT (DUF2867 family)